MKQFLSGGLKLAQWYEYLDWHWIPLVTQIFMALGVLMPLRGGMVPAFADEFGIDEFILKAVWFLLFGVGAFVLYVWRNSDAFILGSFPLALYVFAYAGYSISINNYLVLFMSSGFLALIAKVYLRMQNGRIRHDG